VELTRKHNSTVNPVGSPRFTETSSGEEKTPFENFEGLASKLLRVPKEEVDEKRAEREKKRTE
jgi:hypothetical protein